MTRRELSRSGAASVAVVGVPNPEWGEAVAVFVQARLRTWHGSQIGQFWHGGHHKAVLDTRSDHAVTSTAIIKSPPVVRRRPPL